MSCRFTRRTRGEQDLIDPGARENEALGAPHQHGAGPGRRRGEFSSWALQERLIAGAALDVYEPEPDVTRTADDGNVVLAPHVGSATRETRTAMADSAVAERARGPLRQPAADAGTMMLPPHPLVPRGRIPAVMRRLGAIYAPGIAGGREDLRRSSPGSL